MVWIQCRSLAGSIFASYELAPSDALEDVMILLAAEHKMPVETQVLIYNNVQRTEADAHRTLSSIGITGEQERYNILVCTTTDVPLRLTRTHSAQPQIAPPQETRQPVSRLSYSPPPLTRLSYSPPSMPPLDASAEAANATAAAVVPPVRRSSQPSPQDSPPPPQSQQQSSQPGPGAAPASCGGGTVARLAPQDAVAQLMQIFDQGMTSSGAGRLVNAGVRTAGAAPQAAPVLPLPMLAPPRLRSRRNGQADVSLRRRVAQTFAGMPLAAAPPQPLTSASTLPAPAAAAPAFTPQNTRLVDLTSQEVQQQLYDEIQRRNIDEALRQAIEYTPEAFAPISMLYVRCEVNQTPVIALVDSGAQGTFINVPTAERCGLMRLLDRRGQGTARGVGSQRILGRVHMVAVKLNGILLTVSLNVIENDSFDLLFGLDQLQRHRAVIDLQAHCLRIGDGTVPFIKESELPEWVLPMAERYRHDHAQQQQQLLLPPSPQPQPQQQQPSPSAMNAFQPQPISAPQPPPPPPPLLPPAGQVSLAARAHSPTRSRSRGSQSRSASPRRAVPQAQAQQSALYSQRPTLPSANSEEDIATSSPRQRRETQMQPQRQAAQQQQQQQQPSQQAQPSRNLTEAERMVLVREFMECFRLKDMQEAIDVLNAADWDLEAAAMMHMSSLDQRYL